MAFFYRPVGNCALSSAKDMPDLAIVASGLRRSLLDECEPAIEPMTLILESELVHAIRCCITRCTSRYTWVHHSCTRRGYLDIADSCDRHFMR